MKQVISIRDVEEMLRHGKDVRSLPADALLDGGQRGFQRDMGLRCDIGAVEYFFGSYIPLTRK